MSRAWQPAWQGIGACLFIAWVGGCADCDPPVEQMRAFILDPDNQVCTTDADCVTAHVGCADVGLDFCGQVGMNRTAAQSRAWRALTEEAIECEPSCNQCFGELIVTCGNNRCFSPSG